MLRSVGRGAAADPLVDVTGLLGEADGLSVRAEDVGGRGSLDRRRDVQVRRGGQVDGRRQIQSQIDVGVDVEEREHFLVRKIDGVFGLDLVHRNLVSVFHHSLLVKCPAFWP